MQERTVTRWIGSQRETRTVKPQVFDRARAEAIWAQRDIQGCVSDNSDMTWEEVAYVHYIWDQLPGNTSFMTAFHRIRTGRLPEVRTPAS